MITTTLDKKEIKATTGKSKKTTRTNEWRELVEKKEDFKHIVHILNRYYDLCPSASHPSPAHLFRQDIVSSELSNLKIFLRKFGSFEFLVVVEITTEQGKRMDSWIHIDGIAQERIILKEKGKLDHPVFKITSLDDLFQSHTKEVEKGFKPIDDII